MADELIATGAAAPAFEAATTGGNRVSLDDFRGREAVLLMFYPQDDTPGCTAQMCAARDEGAAYREAGVARFGVNEGSVGSHEGFATKYALDFPLIVDADGAIARAYGAAREGGGTGRATVLIDRNGTVVFAQRGAHGADAVLEALRG